MKTLGHDLLFSAFVFLLIVVLLFALIPSVTATDSMQLDAVSGVRLAISRLCGTKSHDILTDCHQNGLVSVSASDAKAGTLISFQIHPGAGYKVSSVGVITSNGNYVKLSFDYDSTYSFNMPKDYVIIDVSFQRVMDF